MASRCPVCRQPQVIVVSPDAGCWGRKRASVFEAIFAVPLDSVAPDSANVTAGRLRTLALPLLLTVMTPCCRTISVPLAVMVGSVTGRPSALFSAPAALYFVYVAP